MGICTKIYRYIQSLVKIGQKQRNPTYIYDCDYGYDYDYVTVNLFFLLKGLVADATDAPQPWRLIVQLSDKDDEGFSTEMNEMCRGKPKYSGKTCPSATLFTTNPIWTDPGSNPGLRGERPATNRLSHGTVDYES
jgi:hypothetical protein